VGSYLRHDALATLVNVKAGHHVQLRRVIIEQLSSGNKRFRARLDVDLGDGSRNATGAGMPQEGIDAARAEWVTAGLEEEDLATAGEGRLVRVEIKSPFEAMALALRYGAWVQPSSQVALYDRSLNLRLAMRRFEIICRR
jgi:hypothetical protein